MGGVEPPSRTASRQDPTCVVGILCAAVISYRRDSTAVSQTAFGDCALANFFTAAFLGDACYRPQKAEDRQTRYLEVSDLGSVSKRWFRISWLPIFTRLWAPRHART